MMHFTDDLGLLKYAAVSQLTDNQVCLRRITMQMQQLGSKAASLFGCLSRLSVLTARPELELSSAPSPPQSWCSGQYLLACWSRRLSGVIKGGQH